jgi:hypothetical protein
VGSLIEEVRVCVQRDAWPRMPQDSRNLSNVEAQVDDQVAGECVAKVMQTERRPVLTVQPSLLRRPPQAPSLDVAVALRRPQ